jgi:hypothetical protein
MCRGLKNGEKYLRSAASPHYPHLLSSLSLSLSLSATDKSFGDLTWKVIEFSRGRCKRYGRTMNIRFRLYARGLGERCGGGVAGVGDKKIFPPTRVRIAVRNFFVFFLPDRRPLSAGNFLILLSLVKQKGTSLRFVRRSSKGNFTLPDAMRSFYALAF